MAGNLTDVFNNQDLIDYVYQIKDANMWGCETFCSETVYHDVDTIRLDFIDDKRRVMPFINPLAELPVTDRIGFRSGEVKIPYQGSKMKVDPAFLVRRLPGEDFVNPARRPADRAATLIANDILTLQKMARFRKERMFWEAVTTGIQTVLGEGINYTIDYLYQASHKLVLSGTSLWTNAASDPFAILRDSQRICIRDSGVMPREVVMGKNAVNAFVNNPTVLRTLDTWYLRTGEVKIEGPNNQGVRNLGSSQGFNFWEYINYSINPVTGVEEPMVPDNTVVLLDKEGRAKMHYGYVSDIGYEDSGSEGGFFVKTWTQDDPSLLWTGLKTSPLPAIERPDAYFTIIAT